MPRLSTLRRKSFQTLVLAFFVALGITSLAAKALPAGGTGYEYVYYSDSTFNDVAVKFDFGKKE